YGEQDKITTYYGSNFRHVAAPTKPIVGVVRDKDTKKPLAGVTVRSLALTLGPSSRGSFDLVRTTTDAQGRYRLTGMPKREGNLISAHADSDLPYVAISKEVADSPGLDPVTVDIELPRGVWIEGKITEKVTGQPLRASLEYFALYSNPNLPSYPGFDGTFSFDRLGVGTKEDGSYRVAGLPGPGLIAVYPAKGYHLRVPDRDDEYGTTEKSLSTSPYHISFTNNYAALARVDPPKGVDSVKRDVTLDPGWALKGTVLGLDGVPLTGARVLSLNGYRIWWEREPLKTAEFTGWFNPRLPRAFLLRHLEKQLVGVAQPPKENGGAVTVRMERGAVATGRLVDANGRPRAGVDLEVRFHPKGWGSWIDYRPERIKTDREGRFRLEALLPEYQFRLSDDQGEWPFDAPPSGQTKDLGDVQMKRAEKVD
ncbi:MAG TPA: hypothetical protein VG013_20825, partial [Gemmataceae bacterium]|nr:hypothetical protein [Gemmataceae bacterium]